jgi:hypothetical protein
MIGRAHEILLQLGEPIARRRFEQRHMLLHIVTNPSDKRVPEVARA